MQILENIISVISILFFVCYFYQFIYIAVPFLKKEKRKADPKNNSFAVLICARNEREVIADLIKSIKNQTYDENLIKVFVMADNCTDDTAQKARKAGAVVYERFDKALVGKGYALKLLLQNISRDFPNGFDGYFVFDADNLLSEDYIEKMNRVFSDGYDIVTSYRNSKNYGDNWISAGYALWFLRESKYLNCARMRLGTSCAVSGTGFVFSRKILREQGDWPFHLLTEDIEFSVHHITEGYRIGFADAVLYDEQPVTFSQSWHQRMRWACGFLQVFKKYGKKLVYGMAHGSFSCYDMCMNIMPALVLTMVSIVLNAVLIAMGLASGDLTYALLTLLKTFLGLYLTVFAVGLITVITEWKRIYVSAPKKILYAFTFPLFMMTYIPISVAAVFKKNTCWKPIVHHGKATSVPERQKPFKSKNKIKTIN